MLLRDFDNYFRNILDMNSFKNIDVALNGLQVTRVEQEITRVAFAVDAALTTIEQAAQQKADMLFVHHGIFWGSVEAMIGGLYTRIAALIKHDIALYACHLPLDAHPVYGNNTCLAHAMGLSDVVPFGCYRGKKIGIKGVFAPARARDSVVNFFSSPLAVLPFGGEKIKTVAIISGGAPFEVRQAIEEHIDLYVTGDASHSVYHQCREAEINMISAGHYATETWGVRSLKNLLEQEKNIECTFIDAPTAL